MIQSIFENIGAITDNSAEIDCLCNSATFVDFLGLWENKACYRGKHTVVCQHVGN